MVQDFKHWLEKYKVADTTLNLLEPPTRLKKVGDGIKVDIEKTSGDEVSRKKNKVKFSKKVKNYGKIVEKRQGPNW